MLLLDIVDSRSELIPVLFVVVERNILETQNGSLSLGESLNGDGLQSSYTEVRYVLGLQLLVGS